MARYVPPQFDDVEYVHRGRTYKVKSYREGGLADPISGLSQNSLWVYEQDLIQMIRDAGYHTVHVLGKDMQNRTPHITILAESASDVNQM